MSVTSGLVLAGSGFLLAVLWTGFLRVASQTALLLAPAATAVVVIGWLLQSRQYVNPTLLVPGSG